MNINLFLYWPWILVLLPPYSPLQSSCEFTLHVLFNYKLCMCVCVWYVRVFFLGGGLGFELRVLCLQSRQSAWMTPPLVHFCSGYFGDGISWSICPAWPVILPISASQVSRITVVSCHRQLSVAAIEKKKSWDPWWIRNGIEEEQCRGQKAIHRMNAQVLRAGNTNSPGELTQILNLVSAWNRLALILPRSPAMIRPRLREECSHVKTWVCFIFCCLCTMLSTGT
jgi:hypothetical protein